MDYDRICFTDQLGKGVAVGVVAEKIIDYRGASVCGGLPKDDRK